MIRSLAIRIGLLLTLWLPIYPQSLSLEIVVFAAIAFGTAAGGLTSASGRAAAAHLAPGGLALFIAFVVGQVRQAPTQQALEDALPYLLFGCGWIAAQASRHPRRLLRVTLWVCAADALVSLWKLPSIDEGMRSTYFYFKITAGLPIIGLYLVSVVRRITPQRYGPWTLLNGLFLIAILASVSRGMMLATLAGLIYVGYRRRPHTAILGVFLAAVTLVVFHHTTYELGLRYLRFDQTSTVAGRVREIQIALHHFYEHPWLGMGLGAEAFVDGNRVAFVHNLLAYHGWKFGLIGSGLLLLPFIPIARQLRKTPQGLQTRAWGATIAATLYLTTSAAFKTYYLVWIYAIVIGATLRAFERRRRPQRPQHLAANDPQYSVHSFAKNGARTGSLP